jgi:hypothetical protein
MTLVNHATGELVERDPEEAAAVAMLDRAITALTGALGEMPITEVVSLKARVATVQTATKELGMSKEAQELAAEAVRRAEWALGRAIKKGQAEGEIATHGGVRHGSSLARQDLKPVTEFASNGELYGRGDTGILNLAEADPETFDAAIDAAKAEGNLSRANVARKAREQAGEPKKLKRRPLPDAIRDAGWDLRKSVERLQRLADDDRFSSKKEQVAPRLRNDLTNAIEVCQDLLDRINNN